MWFELVYKSIKSGQNFIGLGSKVNMMNVGLHLLLVNNFSGKLFLLLVGRLVQIVHLTKQRISYNNTYQILYHDKAFYVYTWIFVNRLYEWLNK